MSTDTGTTSFLDRMKLTERTAELLHTLFEQYDFYVQEFGYDLMLRDELGLKARMKKLESKSSRVSLMVKFSPDYLVSFQKGTRKDLFYADVKASITPVFFNSQITRIRDHSRYEVTREDLLEIEREAWLTYNTFYPPEKVLLVIATPYNPKLILAEWISNIKCLWCLKKGGNLNEGIPPLPWNCKECPIFARSGDFGITINEFAGGSKTPHTNLHMGLMRPLRQFLKEEFNVKVDLKEYATLENVVKSWDLNKPSGSVNWTQFNNVVNSLKDKCPWLQNRWPIVQKQKKLN